MKITEIFAEIQANPDNTNVYRQLIDFYKTYNKQNEASAFEFLLEKKYGLNNSDINQKQSKSDC